MIEWLTCYFISGGGGGFFQRKNLTPYAMMYFTYQDLNGKTDQMDYVYK